MNIKEVILAILCYCGLKFVDKFIEDNLPNLHYKNIIKGFIHYVLPYVMMAYIAILYLQLKISSDKETQKNLQHTLLIFAAVLLAYQALKQNKLHKKSEV